MDNKHGGNIHKIRREQKKDDIIDFSANINPLGISQKCKDRIIESIDDLIHYPDPDYYELLESIANNHKVDKDHIILGNGAIECIFKIGEIEGLKKAMILAPTFIEYERAFLKNGVLVDKYMLKASNEFKFDLEGFMASITEETDIIVICNPNNPTGDLIKKDDLQVVLDYCSDKKIKLVIDEAFADFLESEADYSMVDALANKQLFVLRSLTKFYAIPGLRLGYVMTQNDDFKKANETYKIPWTINTIAANIAVEALQDFDYIQETKALVQREREFLYESLSAIEALKVYQPSVNYIFFSYQGQLDLKVELEVRGFMIRSCENYTNLDARYFRVAVKNNEDNRKLLLVLSEILEL